MTSFFPLLAFEAANFSASVAVFLNATDVIEETFSLSSQPLIAAIDHVMTRANITPQQLKGVVTTTGPGSFTGLRNSMAVSKAFSLTLTCPILGISSFEWIFRCQNSQKSLGIILDSRRHEPFCALYNEKGVLIKGPTFLPEEDSVSFMEGADIYDARALGLPTATALGRITFNHNLWQRPQDYPLTPLYVRSADIGKP